MQVANRANAAVCIIWNLSKMFNKSQITAVDKVCDRKYEETLKGF